MEADIRTQKLSYRELLIAGYKVYSANFTNILGIIVCVLIPNDVIRVLIRNATLFENFGKINYVATSLLESMFDLLINAFAVIGIAIIVDQSLQGITLSWKGSKTQFFQVGCCGYSVHTGSIIVLCGCVILDYPWHYCSY
jgi:hypothetical protein